MPRLTTGTRRERAEIVPPGIWKVDPNHSSVEFEIKNFEIVTVTGYFGDFEGTLVSHGDLASVQASGAVRTASVITRAPSRDERLRSDEFFAAERFPEIQFRSGHLEQLDHERVRIVGELSIKEASRQVDFEAAIQGPFLDHRGCTRLAIDATTVIDRLDFGLDWDEEGPDGRKMAGHAVRLVLHLGALRVEEASGG